MGALNASDRNQREKSAAKHSMLVLPRNMKSRTRFLRVANHAAKGSCSRSSRKMARVSSTMFTMKGSA